MKYLCCTDAEQQRASNAYLHMTETEFFALDTKVGRRYAVCNLLGLVKFWEEIEDAEKDVEIEGDEKDVENEYAVGDAVSEENQ